MYEPEKKKNAFGSGTESHPGQEPNLTQVGNQIAFKPRTKLHLDPRTKSHLDLRTKLNLDPNACACACASVSAQCVCLYVRCA